MGAAARSIDALRLPETIKNIANILRTNVHAAMSLGHAYITQLGRIYLDVLNVYKAYSEMISNAIATQGPQAAYMHVIRAMRSVKKETLKLIEAFIERQEDPQVHTMSVLCYCECIRCMRVV